MLVLSALWTFVLLAIPILAQDPAEDPAETDAARCPAIPGDINLTPLNDPFTFQNGRPVRTRQDWTCRRAEIAEFLQRYGLGRLPTTRPKVVGEVVEVDNSSRPYAINVTVTEGDKTISFSAPVIMEKDPKKPVPAIILVGGASIPQPPGVAYIVFNNDLIASQTGASSRGQGLFYDLYGANHSAGSMIAWAWGVGRLIDALEQVQDKGIINAKRLGLTGCSRNGKGTTVIGAFEPRIALTIPQESGAGGTSCWRIQDALKDRGVSTQTAAQIVTENTWHGKVFDDYVRKVGVLPYDNHLLTALIAPRALLSIENGIIQWLGPESSYGCQTAARTVWKALGVEDRIGFRQTPEDAAQNHCQFPESHQEALTAFVDRFLKGERVETDEYFKSDAEFPKFDLRDWIRWDTPRLR